MKLLALAFFIIINLVANHAYAQGTLTQPLTRADCDKARMAWDENANACKGNSVDVVGQPLTNADCDKAGAVWNDNANVCEMASREDPTAATPEAAAVLSQPLTRSECDRAGMTWDDQANACVETGGSAAQAAPTPVPSTILVNIDKSRQRMTVSMDGIERYDWPVSTGQRGYSTPSGTYTAKSMNEIWYSKQWDNAPMPHAIFFTKKGHAIHGTNEVKRLGKPASHGCVRLSPQNAATLYALVADNGLENTEVVLTGVTLGGDGKVASPARSKSRSSLAAPRSVNSEDLADSEAQPQRRGGLFRRLFGRRPQNSRPH